jgi:hypothetical protein
MPLTDVQVRQARPKDKEYKLSDERGLLLVVRPTGAKWWRLRYQFQGKEQMISLGVYPMSPYLWLGIGGMRRGDWSPTARTRAPNATPKSSR